MRPRHPRSPQRFAGAAQGKFSCALTQNLGGTRPLGTAPLPLRPLSPAPGRGSCSRWGCGHENQGRLPQHAPGIEPKFSGSRTWGSSDAGLARPKGPALLLAKPHPGACTMAANGRTDAAVLLGPDSASGITNQQASQLPGSVVEASPLGRIQQRGAVLLSFCDEYLHRRR